MIRASWSDVTLAEYAALDIIWREDCETLLNAYWDALHASGRVITNNDEPLGEPTRLTADGSTWLAELHATVTTTTDEREQIKAAKDFMRSMGVMLTMSVKKGL